MASLINIVVNCQKRLDSPFPNRSIYVKPSTKDVIKKKSVEDWYK